MCRTKIVATLGPACDTPEMIRNLIRSGVDVFRLNFSHGSRESHGEYIRRIREAAETLDMPVAILMDLQGPKIRTGPLENGAPVTLLPGQPFTVTARDVTGNNRIVGTSYKSLPDDVHAGDRLLISDGLIELAVEKTEGPDILCNIVTGGVLSQRQGINLPGVQLTAPSLTEKDRADLDFGLKQDIDYVALSFVRSADSIAEVKSIASDIGCTPPVIAKIERPEALDHFPEILAAADGIMVARGDLGVEISPEKVPMVQKQIIAAANRVGKPVITATQMLDSMIRNPRPTRAETSDVANAIIDGTDAVMLSGETATGRYPLAAVRMLAKIAPVVEAGMPFNSDVTVTQWRIPVPSGNSESIADAACSLARDNRIRAIVVFTQSGFTARLIARRRPQRRIFALTPEDTVYRQMALVWGVHPVRAEFSRRLHAVEQQIHGAAQRFGFAQPGDTVVVVGGHPLPEREPTNFLKLLTIESM